MATVFAGGDIEATDRARTYFTGYPPSSPSVAILRDGKLVYMMERRQIENQTADAIASNLTAAFDQFCGGNSSRRSHPVRCNRDCRNRGDDFRRSTPDR